MPESGSASIQWVGLRGEKKGEQELGEREREELLRNLKRIQFFGKNTQGMVENADRPMCHWEDKNIAPPPPPLPTHLLHTRLLDNNADLKAGLGTKFSGKIPLFALSTQLTEKRERERGRTHR